MREPTKSKRSRTSVSSSALYVLTSLVILRGGRIQRSSFLEAMGAWIEDTGQPSADPPTWKTFGDILMAGRVYE